MARRNNGSNPEHVMAVTAAISQRKEGSLAMLQTQFVSTSRCLEEEIESCKRKILACCGQEGLARLAKKSKFAVDESLPVDKENSAPNCSTIRSPVRKVMVVKSPHRSPVNKAGSLELKFNCMKVQELREELKTSGLSTAGKKVALVSRLLKAKMEEIGALQEQQRAPMPAVKRQAKVETAPKPNVVESTSLVAQPSQDTEVIDVDMMDESSTNSMPADSSEPNKQKEVADKMEPTEEVDLVIEESSSHAPEDMSTTSVVTPIEEPAATKLSPMKQASQKMLTHNEAMDPKEYWKSISKSTPGRNGLQPQQQQQQQQQQPIEQVEDSAAKQMQLPLQGIVKNAFKVFSNSPAPDLAQVSTTDSNDDDMTEDDISPPTSEVSAGSKIGGAKVRELVSKISNSSGYQSAIAASTGGGSASSLSKSVQAKKEVRMAKLEEARKARLAEIRNKSKPVLATKPIATPKEYTSTLSSLKATAASTNGKKKNLAAQMREKAAAAYRKEDTKALMESTSSEYDNPHASSVDVTQQQNTFGSAIKQASIKLAQARSPLDTYEISDREDSGTDDSDESDDENEKQKKKIPTWALKTNLIPALERQYAGCDKGQRFDPDDIFPEVQTCDLEAIFDKKKSRYTRRTSSGNWSNDRVTVAETLVYKRTMGFATKASKV